MDEANKKMEALKKAYADIIFNTTKEATAKIMVVERRAYQYQKEMNEAKEEALNMLMRFKAMMDAKVNFWSSWKKCRIGFLFLIVFL
ncbi:hypothetical protein AQUCO_02500170v1 [Aquilegia coerulea]|uniref:Uncharacterized protein n=1 Tax=Aquilegia coerulea TaxID=218851 RepID=A0A2G5D9Z2_AQUCA|nr:hypothetical protein AQUCO_02500170v1 [Aquilegia coerulea]